MKKYTKSKVILGGLVMGLVAVFAQPVAHVQAAMTTEDLFRAINIERVEHKLKPLLPNKELDEAALSKVKDMQAKTYFSHQSPTGVTPWYWLIQAGYRFKTAGENLAINYSDTGEVVKAWMNSPTHRSNILNSKYLEVGYAISNMRYKGNLAKVVVQVFGEPVTN